MKVCSWLIGPCGSGFTFWVVGLADDDDDSDEDSDEDEDDEEEGDEFDDEVCVRHWRFWSYTCDQTWFYFFQYPQAVIEFEDVADDDDVKEEGDGKTIEDWTNQVTASVAMV